MLHDDAAVPGKLGGKLARVRSADDPARRIASENERRKCDRGQQGFAGTRRHIDNEPPTASLQRLVRGPAHGVWSVK
jgi:hypothetical protein